MKKLSNILLASDTLDTSLQNYLKYVYTLKYEELPNYAAILKMF